MPFDTELANDGPRAPGPDRVEVVVAFASIGLGLFVLIGSFSINLGTGYDRIGPRFFPYLVAVGLLLTGSFLAKGALRPKDLAAGDVAFQTSWSAIGTLTLGLLSSVLLLERLGFVLSSSLLFWLVARAFESRSPRRDVIVGLSLCTFVYFAFTKGLGLALPRGILGGLF